MVRVDTLLVFSHLIPSKGLFQSSGAFITSEERSLAFWLSENGFVASHTHRRRIPYRLCIPCYSRYQVFLGNTRGIFNIGHKEYSRNDPRFWSTNPFLSDTSLPPEQKRELLP